MFTQGDREPELDSGGFGRLDVSDIEDAERKPDSCDWCTEIHSSSGAYLVVADNRHFSVCPICWGRSATYLELRRGGLSHETALGKLVLQY